MSSHRPIPSSHFPRPSQHSTIIPGDERIRQNVFYHEPVKGLPCGQVNTVYDLVRKGMNESKDGPYVGEIVNGDYVWTRYSEVLSMAYRIGCGVLSLERDTKRVGLAGIHSLRYITALHSLVDFSITAVPLYHNSKMDDLCHIVESCNLEVIFCDSVERANTFIQRKSSGNGLDCMKTIILMNGGKDEVNGGTNVDIWEWDDVLTRGTLHPREEKPPSPNDVYVICHTSGTTGRPKGVQTTHMNLLAAVAGLYCQWCMEPHKMDFGKDDIYFSFLSLAHIYEHLIENFIVYCGGKVGIYSGDVTKLLQDIQILKPTIVALVPRLLNKFYDTVHSRVATQSFLKRGLFSIAKWYKERLLARGEHRFDTLADRFVFSKLHPLLGGRVRLLTTGGAPVSPQVKNFTRIAYGALLFEGYGQTECGAAGTLNLPCDTTAGHVGGPAPWAQIKLIDAPELGYFSKEDRGEVCFRGAAVMSGYLGDSELTKKSIDEEGWLHTGDIGTWLPNGALAIIDRKNAFFKLAQGDFVAPEMIEGVYGQNQLVQQIFITGRTTRSFLVAVVVVNILALRTSLSNNDKYRHLLSLPDCTLLKNEETKIHVVDELSGWGREKGLTSIEIVKDVHMTNEELTAEEGFLTSTLKMRRHILNEHFSTIVDEMYLRKDNA